MVRQATPEEAAKLEEIVSDAEAKLEAAEMAVTDIGAVENFKVEIDGETHEVQLRPYVKQQAPFTHWYMCPVNNEPVPVIIKQRQNVAVEVDAEIAARLSMCQQLGNFMVIIAYVENGDLRYTRKSFQFPHAFFDNVKQDVANDLDSEFGPPQPDKPMEEAEPPQPLSNPFQNGVLHESQG